MGAFFQSSTAAARYAKSRINFHPYVIEAIGQLLALKTPLPWALDVGCGTGHSTVALRALATNVLGIDPSAAMLTEAMSETQVVYAKSSAERMNVQDSSVPLMTVSQALHWFNSRAFYLESSRVLEAGGNLFIYGHRLDHPCLEFFDEQFPSPHKAFQLNPLELSLFNLSFVKAHNYQRPVVLNLEQTVGYLMTMSAVEVAMQSASSEVIETNLAATLSPSFQQGPLTFASAGTIWWLRKDS